MARLGLSLATFACAGPASDRARTDSVPPVAGVADDTAARVWYLRGCGWSGSPLPGSPVIVDLRLRSDNENRTPTEADVRAVERAGGRVLHRFNVALLRAEVETAQIPTLVDAADGIAESATSVIDPSDLQADVQIFYNEAVTAEDERVVKQLGGRSLGRNPRPVLSAVLPDSSIPVLARQPTVRMVRAVALRCGRPGGARDEFSRRSPTGGADSPRPSAAR